MDITYIAPCFDSSGYGEASRNYIEALDHVGIKVSVQSMSFERQKPELGASALKIQELTKNPDTGRIQIVHMTPENYPRFYRKDKYNIAYTTWETSKLPEGWTPLINGMQEVWVPCEHNIKVFKDSGVTIPIKCVPHTFKSEPTDDKSSLPLQNHNSDEFMFYSIFQWTERKNPLALLKAYLTEFLPHEKVCLVLKTYFVNPENAQESAQLKETIQQIKSRFYLKGFPKILLISSLLSKSQIHALHQSGDCYVSLHRCEGFGIPIVEAMMAGNPAIVTNYGGPEDFGKSINAPIMWPIEYQETPCHGMPWPTYHGHMNWADANVMQARKAMRFAFENQALTKELGQNAKAWAETELSYQSIGTLMKNRLLEIEKEIR